MTELEALRNRLKSGEYDGVDIMKAWMAVEELDKLKTTISFYKRFVTETRQAPLNQYYFDALIKLGDSINEQL